jgi:hypothetical protein
MKYFMQKIYRMALGLSIDKLDSRHNQSRGRDEESFPIVAALAKTYSNTTDRLPCKNTRSSRISFTAFAKVIFSASRPA